MHRITTLGLDERVERVLAYALFWISGLLLLLFEKNQNVRYHAMQSVITFGGLSLIMFGVSLLRGMLSLLPVIGILISFGLGLLLSILGWVWVILWIWLLVMAWVHPNYRLPYITNWIRIIF